MRLLLAVDVAIGLVAAVLVISQATLLARVIAGSFAGSTLDELTRPLVLLLLVFAARAGLAWAFEAVGRLAATSVLSQLRLALSERRLIDRPTALDGAQSAELAAASVFGAATLETYFGRFLPQLVLAGLVPVAVVAWIIPIDAVSAAIMIVTLPLVPVFMILVGGHTARRTEERADALASSPSTSSTSSAASRRCARSIGAARSRSRSPSGASSIAGRPSPPCASRSSRVRCSTSRRRSASRSWPSASGCGWTPAGSASSPP